MTRIAQKSELTVPAIAAWKWENSVFDGSVHELRLFFVWSVRFFITVQLIKKRTKCTVCDLKSKTFLDGNTTNNHGRGDLVPLRQTTSGASRSTVGHKKWFKIIAPMSESAAPTQPPPRWSLASPLIGVQLLANRYQTASRLLCSSSFLQPLA